MTIQFLGLLHTFFSDCQLFSPLSLRRWLLSATLSSLLQVPTMGWTSPWEHQTLRASQHISEGLNSTPWVCLMLLLMSLPGHAGWKQTDCPQRHQLHGQQGSAPARIVPIHFWSLACHQSVSNTSLLPHCCSPVPWKAAVQSSDTNLAQKQQLTQQAAWGNSALLQAHAGSFWGVWLQQGYCCLLLPSQIQRNATSLEEFAENIQPSFHPIYLNSTCALSHSAALQWEVMVCDCRSSQVSYSPLKFTDILKRSILCMSCSKKIFGRTV